MSDTITDEAVAARLREACVCNRHPAFCRERHDTNGTGALHGIPRAGSRAFLAFEPHIHQQSEHHDEQLREEDVPDGTIRPGDLCVPGFAGPKYFNSLNTAHVNVQRRI